MKRIILTGFIILSIFLFSNNSIATDAPHSTADSVNCSSCHTLHGAPSPSLTQGTSNFNLCESCHKTTGLASGKPFVESQQATPAVSGRHHRWDAALPATSNPGNAYGLRAKADLSSADLKLMLDKFSDIITCSVCHNQHSQAAAKWDAFSTRNHFQRIADDMNQMCEDCHYYRVQDHTRVEGGDAGYPANGTNVFSHPVGQTLNANSRGYDRAAPLDVNGSAQSGTRFATGAETPTDNTTNNLVVESTTNKVRCLTCHRVHYSDSNSFTVDGAP
ncbi:MAG: cytochrome c3 family protein [Nitrospirota bacterium]